MSNIQIRFWLYVLRDNLKIVEIVTKPTLSNLIATSIAEIGTWQVQIQHTGCAERPSSRLWSEFPFGNPM